MAQVTSAKTLLITGVSRGFGFALAAEAVAQGYQVLGIVRSEQSRLAVLAQLPTVQLLVADITAPAYENLLTQFVAGKIIDVLINNAGSGSKGKTLATTTAEQLQREFNTHCVAAMLSAKVCQPTLIARNGQLVNISSRRGSMNMQADGAAKGAGCSYSYRIGKAAQNMLRHL
jgi:NAD(P)-dependent dehydrogenase (short-subunit alcohol dehydrogenase family)